MNDVKLPPGVMFNIYPDSCAGNLSEAVSLLEKEDFKDVFSLLYLLPSLFQSDLDRGFSIISYDIDRKLADKKDLDEIAEKGISLKLDFVLNHLSVRSPQFQDMLKKGDESPYKEMFIDWNSFWKNKGETGPEGFIIPRKEYLSKLFMRKPEMPVLKVPFPDGSDRFYWNTFYQEVTPLPQSSGSPRYSYLGQMDLNGESELTWKFYRDTFRKLSQYGARIVRLDAFAYLHKKAGMSNFFNEPGTWEYLERLKKIAAGYNLVLLPEIHSKHEDQTHKKLAGKGYPVYDFFFPGLVINAIETGRTCELVSWIHEIIENGYKTVNMLGCHDGIPLLDVKGLLDDESIDNLIKLIKKRGGRVKDLYGADGKMISYYQVNAAFFSALGENVKKLLLARAIQMFMPGTPQIWYLDLFAGTNDYEAADRKGHKDINRTNLSRKEILERLKLPVVKEQLELLRLRNTHPAFGDGSNLEISDTGGGILNFTWSRNEYSISLEANFNDHSFKIT